MENNEIKNLILEARGGTSPGRLAEIAVELSGHYAFLSEQFGDIEIFRAARWLDIRKDVKSDTMAEKTWLASKEGQEWTKLRIQLKFIEKCISTIRLRLKIAEGERYNQF